MRRGSRGSESLDPGPLRSSPPLKSLSCIALTELEAMKKKGVVLAVADEVHRWVYINYIYSNCPQRELG